MKVESLLRKCIQKRSYDGAWLLLACRKGDELKWRLLNFRDLVDMSRFNKAYFVVVCSTKSANLV
jgi:hypothetical protein